MSLSERPEGSAGSRVPHDDDFPTPREVVTHDTSVAAPDRVMSVLVGHVRLVPKYGIGRTRQLGPGALLLRETGGTGPDVDGDNEQGVRGASARKKGGRNTAGGDRKDYFSPGANTGKEGDVNEGLDSTPWSVSKDKTPS